MKVCSLFNHPESIQDEFDGLESYFITCGLLRCFYQLFELSFWRHPFTAEDPSSDVMLNFMQIFSDEETNSSTSWMAWGQVHFQPIFIFVWTTPLTVGYLFIVLQNLLTALFMDNVIYN